MPAREYNLKAYAAITWHNDPASLGLEPRLADHRSQAARTNSATEVGSFHFVCTINHGSIILSAKLKILWSCKPKHVNMQLTVSERRRGRMENKFPPSHRNVRLWDAIELTAQKVLLQKQCKGWKWWHNRHTDTKNSLTKLLTHDGDSVNVNSCHYI